MFVLSLRQELACLMINLVKICRVLLYILILLIDQFFPMFLYPPWKDVFKGYRSVALKINDCKLVFQIWKW